MTGRNKHFAGKDRRLGLLKDKIMGCFLRYALMFTANSKSAYMSINSSSKINFYFLLILLYLSIANWQVLVSKYKCTSSKELLAMQLISAGGGISSLSSKKWFCLLDLADIYAILLAQKDPKVSILERVDRTKEIIITS